MKNLHTLLLTISVLVFLSGASVTTAAPDSHANWETKFNDRLPSHPELASRIAKLLPAGMDLKAAEIEFKNPGQFIAALHVSKNLNIPFDQVKAKVTGITVQADGQTTSSAPMSLGKAIHELRPNMTLDQANDAAKIAEKQASDTEKADTKVSD